MTTDCVSRVPDIEKGVNCIKSD
ncbi:uncharacterized protein METZ01_LOCUS372095 [marine metagenome]|uniref:Uncharacterized protein n=1 Tax=marine metagenome TaxID=408172 RepID=A0A382TCY1_9ZZZZ